MFIRRSTAHHRIASAFTLTELIVVVTVIVLAVMLMVPSLTSIRRNGDLQVTRANLANLMVIQGLYAGTYQDSIVNPFSGDRRDWAPNASNWAHVRGPDDPRQFWDFSVAQSSSIFAAHWSWLALKWAFPDQLPNPAMMYDPNDEVGLMNYATYVNTPNLIFDSSYWMSPTIWTSAWLYNTTHILSPGINRNDPSHVARNRFSDVRLPDRKVIVFPREDFERTDRRSARGGREQLPPMWNNPESTPPVALADGSVVVANMAFLRSLSVHHGDSAPSPKFGRWSLRDKFTFTPLGAINLSNGLGFAALSSYGMENYPIENGENTTFSHPAFFWATREGILGRDLY